MSETLTHGRLGSNVAGSPPRRGSRAATRRKTFLIQFSSYMLGALILGFYAKEHTVSASLALLFVLIGGLVTAIFTGLSEIHVNDRFADHYLVVPQAIAHIAVQYGFLIAAPQVAYAFLPVVFLIFCISALRMSPTQTFVTWLVMTAGAFVVFMVLNLPMGMALDTPGERMAGLLAFVATVGQCAFAGLYNSALRNKLYRSGLELQKAYSRIEELAEVDELTGALNRRSIMRKFDAEVVASRKNGVPCSVAIIDLDWFKRINDLFGHPTGDEVLRTFAIAVFANIRPTDCFGRYGGEEFLLVMPNTPNDAAAKLLDRLRGIVAELDWSALAQGMNVTISAGVVTAVEDESTDAVLARSDRLLYVAKRGGRNRVEARG